MKHAILIALLMLNVGAAMAEPSTRTPLPSGMITTLGPDAAVQIIDIDGTAYLKNYAQRPLQVTLETNGVVVAVVAIGSDATVCLGPTRELKMRIGAIDGVPVNTEP